MKRVLLIFVLFCLVLSGCSSPAENTAGAYDGMQIEKRPIRMIRVDGKLYYDSMTVSDLAFRCGTMDGSLVKTVGEGEIPKNDGECNFYCAQGYQNATSITKVIPIDGEWIIFKQFDDAGRDMSKLKYCYYIKGRTPNAEKDTELVVLSEKEEVTFVAVMEPLFSSQFKPDEKAYETAFAFVGSSDKWGITLTATGVTKTGLTLECEQFGGDFTGKLQTGSWYRVERNDNDGWREVMETGLCQFVWDTAAILIPENERTKWHVDWARRYGNLPAGSYRIAKEIMDFRGTGNFDNQIYYAYFTID